MTNLEIALAVERIAPAECPIRRQNGPMAMDGEWKLEPRSSVDSTAVSSIYFYCPDNLYECALARWFIAHSIENAKQAALHTPLGCDPALLGYSTRVAAQKILEKIARSLRKR